MPLLPQALDQRLDCAGGDGDVRCAGRVQDLVRVGHDLLQAGVPGDLAHAGEGDAGVRDRAEEGQRVVGSGVDVHHDRVRGQAVLRVWRMRGAGTGSTTLDA